MRRHVDIPNGRVLRSAVVESNTINILRGNHHGVIYIVSDVRCWRVRAVMHIADMHRWNMAVG